MWERKASEPKLTRALFCPKLVRHLAALGYRRHRARHERADLAIAKTRADQAWAAVRGRSTDQEWERLLESASATTEYAQCAWRCRQAAAAWRRAWHGIIRIALDEGPTGGMHR